MKKPTLDTSSRLTMRMSGDLSRKVLDVFLGSIILYILTIACLAARKEPEPIPAGFYAAGLPKHYGTPEQKRENGSIFDYMDGGGIVYLKYGFRELVHREYTNSSSGRISLDVFTMESSANALAALADTSIAPDGGTPFPLDAPNKTYRFPPDYFIYLVHDQRLIYIHVNDDRLFDTLNRFAAAVLKAEKERENETN